MNAAHLRLAWLLVLLILPGVFVLAIAGTGALDIMAGYCRNLALGRVQLMDADYMRVLLSGRRDLGDALAFGTHPGILGSDSTAVIPNLFSGARNDVFCAINLSNRDASTRVLLPGYYAGTSWTNYETGMEAVAEAGETVAVLETRVAARRTNMLYTRHVEARSQDD